MSDAKTLNKGVREPNWVMLVRFGREADPAQQKWTVVLDDLEWCGLYRVEQVEHATSDKTAWLRARCGSNVEDIIIHDYAMFESSDGRLVIYHRKDFTVSTDMVVAAYAKVVREYHKIGELDKEPLFATKPTLPGDTTVTTVPARHGVGPGIEVTQEFAFKAMADPVEAAVEKAIQEAEEPKVEYPAQEVTSITLTPTPSTDDSLRFLYVNGHQLIGLWRIVKREVLADRVTFYATNDLYSHLCALNERHPFIPAKQIYSAVHLTIPAPYNHESFTGPDAIEGFVKY